MDRWRGRVLKSVNELAELTGRDRRTVTTRLEGLRWEAGPKGAHLYNSAEALLLIYQVDKESTSLDQAKTEQALEAAALSKVRREELQRRRLPAEMVMEEIDDVTQAVAATLKAARGKKLTIQVINELLGKFRGIPGRLKW